MSGCFRVAGLAFVEDRFQVSKFGTNDLFLIGIGGHPHQAANLNMRECSGIQLIEDQLLPDIIA